MAVADALLTYLQAGRDGSLALHQRWIELDRGTARPAEHLAAKISAYTRLRYFALTGSEESGEPLWRSSYRSWPHLLIVLAGQSPERMRLRIQRTLVLHQSDPANRAGAAIPLAFVALEDLQRQGPFAAIFTAAEHPTQPVDWLGQPQPKDR
jgi:hypothetical protein